MDSVIEEKINKFSIKMQRGYFHKHILKPYEQYEDLIDAPMISKWKRYRKPPKPDEVIAICHEVIV